MAAEAGASTVVEVAFARAAEADVHTRRPLRGMQVRVPQVLMVLERAGTQRDPATIIHDPEVIPAAEISGTEIPRRRLLLSPMAGGIPLAAQVEAADPRAGNRLPARQATREGSMSLAEIARLVQQGQSVAFQGRAAKSGKMRPRREMLCPDLNRLPPFTIRLAVRLPQDQDSGRTRHSQRPRDFPAGQRWLATVDFRVA